MKSPILAAIILSTMIFAAPASSQLYVSDPPTIDGVGPLWCTTSLEGGSYLCGRVSEVGGPFTFAIFTWDEFGFCPNWEESCRLQVAWDGDIRRYYDVRVVAGRHIHFHGPEFLSRLRSSSRLRYSYHGIDGYIDREGGEPYTRHYTFDLSELTEQDPWW